MDKKPAISGAYERKIVPALPSIKFNDLTGGISIILL